MFPPQQRKLTPLSVISKNKKRANTKAVQMTSYPRVPHRILSTHVSRPEFVGEAEAKAEIFYISLYKIRLSTSELAILIPPQIVVVAFLGLEPV